MGSQPSQPYAGLLARGAGAGAIAGVAAGLVSLFVVEPPLQAAIALEQAHSTGSGHGEMFGRSVQVAGGVAAAIVVGVVLGALFATAFAAAHRRLPGRTEFGRSVALAVVGFTAVGLLPAIKYPASPPGVGTSGTVAYRTAAYLALIAAGLVIAYGTGRLRDGVATRTAWPVSWRTTLVVAAAAAALALVLVLWPANPDPMPGYMPASLLWRFRLAALAEVFTLWAVLGLAFGVLLDRAGSARVARAIPGHE